MLVIHTPPNQGLPNMHELYIDYLQYSLPPEVVHPHYESHTPITPLPFFKYGSVDALGLRYYSGHVKSDRVTVVASGSAMHNARVSQYSDRDSIEYVLENGGKITRMDIAITDYVADELITPECIARQWSNSEIVGTLATDKPVVISSIEPDHIYKPQTVYIGDLQRRGKRGVFRAYDKGIELGICADIITRLELEERGTNAHNSAKRYHNGASLAQIIGSRLKFKNKRMGRFFDEEPLDMSRGDTINRKSEDEKMINRYHWMMNQVAPAIKEFVEYERDRGHGDVNVMTFLVECGIIEGDDKKREDKVKK